VLVASPNCSNACSRNFNVGLSQVTAGLAWWYRQYAKEQPADDLPKYETAELCAQSRHHGLWDDKSPIAPWDWRKGDHGQ